MAEMGKYEDNLYSNSFRKSLLKDIEFDKLKSAFKSDNPRNFECWEYIYKIPVNLIINYRSIVNIHCKNEQNTKCCRDINYYFDLIIGIIRSSKLKEDDKREYIEQVENYWDDKFARVTGYHCKREVANYSKEKRSILKQLYDICEDKDMSDFSPDSYNEHLENKWTEIINSNSSNIEDLYFHINGESLNKKVKYGDFLLKFENIDCSGYKNINLSHILVKRESLEQKSPVNIPRSQGDSAEINVIPTTPQENHVIKTENATSNILDLKKLPITFVSLSGIGSFFFILYKV